MTMQPPSSPPPRVSPEQKLEQILTEHFAVALEPQRGRAKAAFLAQIDQASAPIPITRARQPDRVVPRRALWYWAGVPSLVAAGLAVVVTMQAIRPVTPGRMDPNVDPIGDPIIAGAGGAAAKAAPKPAGTLVFDQLITSQELNGGVAVLPDQTPVRVVRHLETRHSQWVDPNDKAVYSLTEEPIERVGYMKIQPN